MTKQLPPSEMPYWPAAMNQQMAAAYCGISVDTFSQACPVQPIAITKSKAGKRYLRIRLDEWLLSLEAGAPPPRQGMGALRLAKLAERASR